MDVRAFGSWMSAPKCLFFLAGLRSFVLTKKAFAPRRPMGHLSGRPRDIRTQYLLFGLHFRALKRNNGPLFRKVLFLDVSWQFPNLVVCTFYADAHALFCALLRPFAFFCGLAFALFCVHLRPFACLCVFLRTTASRTTAFGNFRVSRAVRLAQFVSDVSKSQVASRDSGY